MPVVWNWDIVYVAVSSTYTWPHDIPRKAQGRAGRVDRAIMTQPGHAVLEAEGVEQDTELQL